MFRLRPWRIALAVLCFVVGECGCWYFMGHRNHALMRALGEPEVQPQVISSFGPDPRAFLHSPEGQAFKREADRWQAALEVSHYGGRALAVYQLLVGLGIMEWVRRGVRYLVQQAESVKQGLDCQLGRPGSLADGESVSHELGDGV